MKKKSMFISTLDVQIFIIIQSTSSSSKYLNRNRRKRTITICRSKRIVKSYILASLERCI